MRSLARLPLPTPKYFTFKENATPTSTKQCFWSSANPIHTFTEDETCKVLSEEQLFQRIGTVFMEYQIITCLLQLSKKYDFGTFIVVKWEYNPTLFGEIFKIFSNETFLSNWDFTWN